MVSITRRDAVKLSAGAAVAGGALPLRLANAANPAGQNVTGEPTVSIERLGIIGPASGKPFTDVAPIISYATIRDRMVYLAGITADPTHPGDVKDQTKQVLDRIDLLLSKAGTSKSNLLTAQVWLTDMSLFAEHNAAWNTWADPKNPPVRACLHSPQLWHPGLLVEIMVTAAT
jgi:enamine deaminase RidA (YjgF/YER057c/UK114 family)